MAAVTHKASISVEDVIPDGRNQFRFSSSEPAVKSPVSLPGLASYAPHPIAAKLPLKHHRLNIWSLSIQRNC